MYKKWSKGVKSDNFCYRKVGRAKTTWRAKEKSEILLSQFNILEEAPKNISHFGAAIILWPIYSTSDGTGTSFRELFQAQYVIASDLFLFYSNFKLI